MCIIFFLLLKRYRIKEGHINKIGTNISDIPHVPNDAICMILHSMGVDINRMEYLENKCLSKSNEQKKDDSNICRA